MRVFIASVAAMAMSASGAHAQGNGGGNGGERGNGKPAVAEKSRGQDRLPGRATGQDDLRGEPHSRAVRGMDGIQRQVERARENGTARARDLGTAALGNDKRGGNGMVQRTGFDHGGLWLEKDRAGSLVEGCPPGLAKKRNGCTPPGQLRNGAERSLFGIAYQPGLFGLSNYARGDYHYKDGYLLRYGGEGIAGWIPLLGGALGVGRIWPAGYASYEVPDYYVDYYGLGGPDRYRYADNVIYRVDPADAAIVSIAALITGDRFVVGQPLPMGYDVYNVPADYRDRYYDTDEAMYRYADGYIYRVDPETRLIAAAIDLLI